MMADTNTSIQAENNEVLLHPDALRCLQKKQLASLCIRLDLKATGKKDELVARLESYNQDKAGLNPIIGTFVQARPRLRSLSMASMESLDNKENEVGMMGISYTKEADAISVPTHRKSILGYQKGNESGEATTPALPSSSVTNSIYPWKRMSSASSLKVGQNKSGSPDSTVPVNTALSRDDTMTIDEFGKGSVTSQEAKGSFNNLEKWLTRSTSTTSAKSITIKISEMDTSAPIVPPVSSPAAKRKRDDDDEMESRPFYMCDMPEVPVKRLIKARPSRAPRKIDPEIVQASDAASKVLEEMNARLQQNGKTQLPLEGALSINLKPPPSPLKSLNARTKGRFSGEHAKHFRKMDSIASHYAAKRIELANKEWRCASSGSTSSNQQAAVKRLKIAEPTEEQVAKTTEHRAAIQKKLEISRQRRRSVSKPGLKSRFTGAVRGFVGAAVGLTNAATNSSAAASLSAPKVQARKPSPSPALISSPKAIVNAKPVFDLKASLAKKPTGYKPYSAKETVQLLQAAASPSKATQPTAVAPSPIRSGWTVVNTSTSTAGPVIPPRMTSNKAASSSIAFASLSKEMKNDLAAEVKAAPTIVRRPSAHITAARKTRSSVSNTRKGPLQAEKLKREAKVNDKKHQASILARQKTQSSVKRAVEKSEKIAAEINSGVGRGTTRKASSKQVMDGAGRGQAAVKRVS